MDSAKAAYESVPYASHAFAQTHPRRLATIGRLFGLPAAPFAGCRVLELGCAAGGNLLPMAIENPDGQFVGVDLSGRSLAQARVAVSEFGLTNVEFFESDIVNWDYSGPPFDYVIAHGLFSWIPAAAQRELFAICQRHLGAHGIAYVSFNTLPGWSLRGAVRDYLRFSTASLEIDGDGLAVARAAREQLTLLTQATAAQRAPQVAFLRSEAERLAGLSDDYLLHEFLANDNRPRYLHEFLDEARQHGLKFLGEAEYSWMTGADLPAESLAALRARSRDAEQFEQFLDFARWQMFRQTLLCRDSAPLQRDPPADVFFPMWYAADMQAESPRQPLSNGESLAFQRPQSRLTTAVPIAKAALMTLAGTWPRWWPFERLLRASLQRLGITAPADMPPAALPLARELAETLRRAWGIALVEASVEPPPVAAEVSDCPRASAWARREALNSGLVPNQFHAVRGLNGFQRLLLAQLDGQRDHEDLLRWLESVERQSRGQLSLTDSRGYPITEEHRIRLVLRETLDRTLGELRQLGFLSANPE